MTTATGTSGAATNLQRRVEGSPHGAAGVNDAVDSNTVGQPDINEVQTKASRIAAALRGRRWTLPTGRRHRLCNHGTDACVVQWDQHGRSVLRFQELVDGLASPSPVTVVIDDQDTSLADPREEVGQLVQR